MIIKLNLTLVNLAGNKEFILSIQGSMALTDVLDEINLSKNDIGMIIKNDRWAPLECLVEENDVVQLFPHLEGG